jgi:hypothetical protein
MMFSAQSINQRKHSRGVLKAVVELFDGDGHAIFGERDRSLAAGGFQCERSCQRVPKRLGGARWRNYDTINVMRQHPRDVIFASFWELPYFRGFIRVACRFRGWI